MIVVDSKEEMVKAIEELEAGETVMLRGTNFTFTASEKWRDLYKGKTFMGQFDSSTRSGIRGLENKGRVLANVKRSAAKLW